MQPSLKSREYNYCIFTHFLLSIIIIDTPESSLIFVKLVRNIIRLRIILFYCFVWILLSGGPKNLSVVPIKDFYYADDVLSCNADAKPAASFMWQNMQTGDKFNSQTFTIDIGMVGQTWTLRCQATNNIQGTIYSANIAVYVTVVARPGEICCTLFKLFNVWQ